MINDISAWNWNPDSVFSLTWGARAVIHKCHLPLEAHFRPDTLPSLAYCVNIKHFLCAKIINSIIFHTFKPSVINTNLSTPELAKSCDRLHQSYVSPNRFPTNPAFLFWDWSVWPGVIMEEWFLNGKSACALNHWIVYCPIGSLLTN